jgi:hypothetical protein
MAKKQEKFPGRVRLTCSCGKDFSTHSTNRVRCHRCLPKCRERHFFGKTPGGRVVVDSSIKA